MSDEPAKCPSCGVPFEDHLGLIGTCAKLVKLRRQLAELYDSPALTMRRGNSDLRLIVKAMLKESK